MAALVRSLLLGVTGGLLLALSFPPFGVGALVLLGPPFLLLALRGRPAPARAASGFLFGWAFFGTLLFWLESVGLHAWILLTLSQAAFAALLALAAGPILANRRPILQAVGWAGLWVLVMETARGRFPLGGFPWGPLGAPLVGTPLDSVAPLGGGLAVSGVVSFAGALVALAVVGQFRAALLGVAIAGAVVAASMPFAPSAPDGARLRVAIVQGNVPLPAAPASPERTAQVLANHVALTRTIGSGQVDLVVWPEDVLDIPSSRPDPGKPAPEPLFGLARELDVWLVAGVVSAIDEGHFLNSAMAVAPSGEVAGVYDKLRPVPFGEYVPGRRYLGFVTSLQRIPRDMITGTGPRLVPVPGGLVGTPVSYETAFARIVRRFADLGANAIVVPTNTSSYGPRAAAAPQELQLSRMRAVELGLSVGVQAAPSGISAFIDPDGNVFERTELYEARILQGEIRLARARTPFARFGETPTIIAAVAASLIGAWPAVRKRVGVPRVASRQGERDPT